MRDFIEVLLVVLFIILLVRACNSDKDMIEAAIDIYSHYKEYAGSVLTNHGIDTNVVKFN